MFDTGLDQDVAVEADAGDPAALEARGELAERVGVLVDHGDRVVLVLQNMGDRRADAPAPHDHDVHGLPSREIAARSRYYLLPRWCYPVTAPARRAARRAFRGSSPGQHSGGSGGRPPGQHSGGSGGRPPGQHSGGSGGRPPGYHRATGSWVRDPIRAGPARGGGPAPAQRRPGRAPRLVRGPNGSGPPPARSPPSPPPPPPAPPPHLPPPHPPP